MSMIDISGLKKQAPGSRQIDVQWGKTEVHWGKSLSEILVCKGVNVTSGGEEYPSGTGVKK